MEKSINSIKTEPWITMRGAQEHTGLSIVKLRKAYNNKEFRISKVTGKILTKRSWLDEWLSR